MQNYDNSALCNQRLQHWISSTSTQDCSSNCKHKLTHVKIRQRFDKTPQQARLKSVERHKRGTHLCCCHQLSDIHRTHCTLRQVHQHWNLNIALALLLLVYEQESYTLCVVIFSNGGNYLSATLHNRNNNNNNNNNINYFICLAAKNILCWCFS